jgi:hypothetical protein
VDFLKKQRENAKFIRALENSATFGLIAFFLFFAIKPTVFTISALLGEIKSKEILQLQMRQKVNSLIQAQDAFSQIQERYLLIDSALPDRSRFSHAAAQLLTSAHQSNTTFNSINYTLDSAKTETKLRPSFAAYQLTSTALAPFSSTINLLDTLSLNRRVLEITQLTLSKDKDKQASVSEKINFNLSLTVPFYPTHEKN